MRRYRFCSMAMLLVSGFGGALLAEEIPVERITRTNFSKFFLRYTPDGEKIAYCRQHANRRGAGLVLVGVRVVKADGTEDRPLLTAFEKSVQIQEHPVFSPDGRTMYLSGGGHDTGNASKDIFQCEIDAQGLATGLRKVIPGDGVQLGEEPALSPDGRRIAGVTLGKQLWMADADGKNKTTVVQMAGTYCHQPDWSPDGEWLAFASDADGNIELYKVRWDGTDLTRLTNEPGIDCRPRWSPDGEWLLFTSNRRGNQDVHIMRGDGTEVRTLTTHPSPDDFACWHPQGQSIAFVSLREGGFDIFRLATPKELRVGGAPQTPLVRNDSGGPGDGPVLHYDFQKPTGETVRDRAGRNHARLAGGARVVTEGDRSVLDLDGATAHLLCGNGEPIRISGPLTLAMWVRPAAFTGNGYLLSKQGWNIYLGADGKARFETRNGNDTAWETLAATTALTAGEWNFVTAVFDPAEKLTAIYVNGRPAGQAERTDAKIGTAEGHPLAVGHYAPTKSQPFRGQLDEVRIYSRALTAESVAQEYQLQEPLVRGKP